MRHDKLQFENADVSSHLLCQVSHELKVITLKYLISSFEALISCNCRKTARVIKTRRCQVPWYILAGAIRNSPTLYGARSLTGGDED